MKSRKRKSAFSKKYVLNWLILLSIIGLLLYLYVGGEYGLYQHWKLSKQKERLLQELNALKLEQDSLYLEIERLKYDSTYIAKIAREKYNMGYPDEEVIRIIKKKD